jgi:3-isopropylmalate dehydrogenase
MAANKQLLVLPGDGIGPEVMGQVLRVVDWFDKRRAVRFDLKQGLVGGASIDAKGAPITEETLADAVAADAVLFGSVGGPKWDALPFEKKPERGILALRKRMDLFANLRPAPVFDALIDASTLKAEVLKGTDLLVLREGTGGVYFGEPRGVETRPDGTKKAVDTQVYTTPEIERIVRLGFELAKKRRNKVHSVEKANVMHTGVLWREVATRIHKAEFADVQLEHMYADNCAMQLVRNPRQFDVIVTDNLFGDILSDCAAMLTGSLGMLPSASLGPKNQTTGKRHALYEPIHGSAPDIAGKGVANPLAQMLSFAMLLRYSFDLADDADLIENAVKDVLASGLRTPDIMAAGSTKVGTTAMGDAVLKSLDRLAA